MSTLPINLARVSTLMSGNLVSQQINQTQQQLLQVQEELSTGQRLNAVSDDPGDAAVVLQLNKTLEQHTTYTNNLQTAQGQLSEVDSSLGDLTNLLQQAQTIASQNAGSTVTADQRQAAAAVVQSLYSQAVSIANKQFEGAYLFGGDKSSAAPFVSSNGGVEFVGSGQVLQNSADDNTLLPFQASGANIFGGLSSPPAQPVNLAPAALPTTRLVDLGGANGTGVHAGAILLGNGTATKLVDLSNADTLQDVETAINNAGLAGVTVTITGNHLTLSAGAGNVSVTDVGGGSTAADLGIAAPNGAGVGTPLVGQNLQPRVTPLTPLSALKDGAGIDTGHGFVITNGASQATINLSSAHTVEDLLNAVNGANVGVRAQINAAGNGIEVLNAVQGVQMSIAENGGTTAGDLGIGTFAPSTPLSQFNGGKGVSFAATGPDFTITRSDGTSFGVTLSGSLTVQDVIGKINAAAGGAGVTASLATTGNGIVLTDTAGGAGKLTVTPQNFSTAAADLGLTTPAAGNVITGKDVAGVGVQGIFADLAALRDALTGNNGAGITSAAEGITADQTRVVTVRGQVGAQVQEVQNRQSDLAQQDVTTKALLSQLKDADLPSTITKFTQLQTALQATLESAGKTLNLSLLNFLG